MTTEKIYLNKLREVSGEGLAYDIFSLMSSKTEKMIILEKDGNCSVYIGTVTDSEPCECIIRKSSCYSSSFSDTDLFENTLRKLIFLFLQNAIIERGVKNIALENTTLMVAQWNEFGDIEILIPENVENTYKMNFSGELKQMSYF